jgi:hypothetical protein
MIHKKLLVLLLVLLTGCTPGIKKVYEKIQTPGSGYLYFCNYQSIEDEIATLQNAVDSLDKNSNASLYNLLKIQLQTAADIKRTLEEYINDTTAWSQSTLNRDVAFTFVGSENPRSDKYAMISRIAYLPQCVRVKPPIPCPPNDSISNFSSATNISFFSRNPEDVVELYKNDQLITVLKKGYYHDLTKIRTVRIPGNLDLKTGDRLECRISVRFADSDKTIKDIKPVYKEIYRK